jgi:hypothetical protein
MRESEVSSLLALAQTAHQGDQSDERIVAEAKAGKRTTKKGSLKVLDAKDGQRIRGGATLSPIVITQPIGSSTP